MHSYADRHTHDFFFERDYPDVKMLDLIWDRLRVEPLARDFVEKQSRVPRDVFEKALEKLWTHGGVVVDANEDLTRGAAEWRDLYIAQGGQKQAQIEAMIRYSQSKECRMSNLVRHFGDTADSKRACGVCDFCAPEQCVAQLFRPADEEEVALARRAVDVVRGDGRALGRLYAELCATNGMDRDSFEELMGALARAGYVRLVEAAFEKDGKQIPFRKAYLTREGEELEDDSPLELSIRGSFAVVDKKGRGKKASSKKAHKKPAAAVKGKASRSRDPEDSRAAALLKEWRKGQAKKQGVPSFRIMSDRVLLAIAEDEPSTLAELLAISGIGLKTVEKYGAQIYKIIEEAKKHAVES